MNTCDVNPCFVGIDVSKDSLDICLLPQEERWHVENKDFDSLCQRLKPYIPTLIVMETTGGYEMPLFKALVEDGFQVKREHAQKIYHHRKARGKRAKTDGIDAHTIAHYAQCHANELQGDKLPEEAQKRLQQLAGRREELVQVRTAEKNRLKSPDTCPIVKASCERIIGFLTQEIAHMDALIEESKAEHPAWQEKSILLQSVPGIAATTANNLLAYLPELGQLSHKQLAALAGVAPYHHESGQYKGERHIQGGRKQVRCCLYMATMVAIRFNERIRIFYQRLVEKGKAKKVAITACMHKLLRILNAMMAKGERFQTELS